MRNLFYLVVAILIPAVSFSQTNAKDPTSGKILDSLCDNKFFEKCEIPVDFKYGKKALEDSVTNYLKEINSEVPNGKATFLFIVAKDGNAYNVKKMSGNILNEWNIIKALEHTAGLWTIGKQNSYLICSYVRLEVEVIENRVKVNMLRRY